MARTFHPFLGGRCERLARGQRTYACQAVGIAVRRNVAAPPMAYLAEWRLRLGAEILQSTEDSVAQVAAAVGYGSEAAFNRAFKREFGRLPAQFRCKGTA